VKGIIDLNEQGYIITDGSLKTSVDGVYAAGDVCIKPLRQVITAAGDGALAATELEKYAASMQRKTGLHPVASEPKVRGSEASAEMPGAEVSAESQDLFTPEMKQQLDTVFDRMERSLVLKMYLNDRPVSTELMDFITALANLSDKLQVEVADSHASSETAPCVKICDQDGRETGLAFHGVPGGHEFTSFVLGLYNAAGPGQAMDEELRQEIKSIQSPADLKILVTLSCSMCPDLVTAAQRIAAESPQIKAEVFDIRHFDSLKNRYNVMSVPCMVVNDEKVFFGKKNIKQISDIIREIV